VRAQAVLEQRVIEKFGSAVPFQASKGHKKRQQDKTPIDASSRY
jgi:hypothetical protein